MLAHLTCLKVVDVHSWLSCFDSTWIEPCRLAPTSAFSISPLNAVVLVLIRQLPAALESQLALIVAERFNSDLFLGLNVHGTHAVSAMRLQLLSHD
jgi:hypothetical protein